MADCGPENATISVWKERRLVVDVQSIDVDSSDSRSPRSAASGRFRVSDIPVWKTCVVLAFLMNGVLFVTLCLKILSVMDGDGRTSNRPPTSHKHNEVSLSAYLTNHRFHSFTQLLSPTPAVQSSVVTESADESITNNPQINHYRSSDTSTEYSTTSTAAQSPFVTEGFDEYITTSPPINQHSSSDTLTEFRPSLTADPLSFSCTSEFIRFRGEDSECVEATQALVGELNL